MDFHLQPLILENSRVRLEPLTSDHASGLLAVGQQAEDWAFLPRPCLASLDDTREWISAALAEQQRGLQLPFAILDQASGRVAGSSRYLNLRPRDRGLEIGWTWLGRDFQRSAINTAAKLLLLQHAFETLGVMRVELKTDARNLRSQAAIERLGASREGLFRRHMIVQQGAVRDTVYFSILDLEWPDIKTNLLRKLDG